MAKAPKSKYRSEAVGRENTLGSQAWKLDALLDDLDSRDGSSVNRSHARWKFRERSVQVLLSQPDGSEVSLKLAARNLSVGGVCLLHSAFVYPGTAITVHLQQRVSGKVVRARGRVRRCDHIQGVIHEIGVKFDESINLHDFQQADPFANKFSYENIQLGRLRGSVIHIDPSQIDRQIVRHLLRDTALSIRGCDSFTEARQFLDKGCDLILSEYRLPDTDGAMMTNALRTDGHTIPVLIVSSSTSPETLEAVRRAAIDVFIPKPIEETRLIAAIAEFLAPESAHQDQKPTGLDEGMRELAGMFANSLSGYADQLDAAAEKNENEQILSIASQIKGSALSLGFEKIGYSAGEVMELLADGANMEMIQRAVRKLITACRTVRPAA